jgi:hypothetical protein
MSSPESFSTPTEAAVVRWLKSQELPADVYLREARAALEAAVEQVLIDRPVNPLVAIGQHLCAYQVQAEAAPVQRSSSTSSRMPTHELEVEAAPVQRSSSTSSRMPTHELEAEAAPVQNFKTDRSDSTMPESVSIVAAVAPVQTPTAKEQLLLPKMLAALSARGVKPRPLGAGETKEDALLRYLRARHHNVEKAANQYAATIKWREEHRVDHLRTLTPDEALGAPVAGMRHFVPHAQTGIDRKGCPIIFKVMGANCRVKLAVEAGYSLDAIGRYNVWLNESYMDALAAAKAREWSVVIDAAGWHLGLFDSYGFKFLKQTATTDSSHYPELLSTMLIVNAPPVLAVAWRVIRTWVDEDTREKIDILSSETSRARLHKMADPAQLPAQYGGTAKPLPGWPPEAGVP